jgi:hypothetical protein
MPIVDNIVTELRGRPYTMLLILGLYGAGVFIWRNEASFASEEQVQSLSAQVGGVRYEVEKTALETRLSNVESELFNTTQKVEDMRRNHRPVESIYLQRINDLQIEKAKLERSLASLR